MLDEEALDVLPPCAVGEPAEKWRELAMLQLGTVERLAAAMADHLRVAPEDDDGFERLARSLQAGLSIAGALLDVFRQTRDCVGGRQ